MKKDITIGEIVATDYRAAAVFKAAGIDSKLSLLYTDERINLVVSIHKNK